MDATIDLLGHQIIEELYAGTRTLVYRGIRQSDQQPVVIKLLRNEFPSFNELVQFRNQYIIAKNLDSANIINTYSLETYHNGYALIMEDFGGISLKQWIGKESFLSIENFLQIAIDLCHTLDTLYQERIIHKDIKPANILINPATKQIKLIDFSIASLLPRETQEIQNANSLEGTLAYISPEQTGRMNRGIDYRSDFYSLGVTFYELLTSQLPFVSSDPMELVHCHLAKTPISVHEINLQIPLVLSEIISKLMAKNAENRYQSALGIKHDLEICLEQLQSTGQIADFEIGQRDISDRFTIPEKLYGREKEVHQLLEAFDRVAGGSPLLKGGGWGSSLSGSSELMLVAGFSGIGKTAVVNEVHKPITKQKGYFIKGKYDQFQRNIPFSAFVQAFRDLMGQLLSESDSQINTWKKKILEVVGDSGQVLVDVIPELELIIGKQPPATELSGSSAQNRFNLLMQNFIKVFTSQEHPLVMFIDDLQWSDSASQNLLKLLMQDTKYLLFLGAYRDNEVSSVHPFILTVDEIVKAGAVVNTMTLQPLSLEDTNQLVADTLNCELFLAQPLTKLVYQKTKGNPFFATQFLKALHDDKLISFDGEIRHWQCDIAQVIALALTDDVVEFMALQLQKLPTETQDMLKLAACIGAEFDLHTLTIVSERSTGMTATALWKALQDGLIIPTTKIYKFFTQSTSEEVLETTANPTYRFLHDRIQQAAYTLIPDERKQSTHLKIGQLLLKNTSVAEQEDQVFEIVNQINIGRNLITQPSEKDQLVQLNLAAALKSKKSTAYGVAFKYLETSMALLPADSWSSQADLTRTIYEEAAEAAFSMGNFEQMEALIHTVLQNTHTLSEQVRMHELKFQSQRLDGQSIQSIALGRKILQELGIKIPEFLTPPEIHQKVESTLALLGNRKIEDLAHLPITTDPQVLVALRILASLGPCAYSTAPYLFPVLVCEAIQLFLKHGNSPFSAPGYADFGIIVGSILDKLEEGYQFGQLALKMMDVFQIKAIQSMTQFKVAAFTQFNRQHLRNSIALLQKSYVIGLETGDFLHMSVSAFYRFLYLYVSGKETLDNIPGIIAAYQLTSAANHAFLNLAEIINQTIDNLTKYHQHPDQLVGESYNEESHLPVLLAEQDIFVLHILFLCKSQLAYLFGDFPAALSHLAQGESYLQGGAAMPTVAFFYYYYGLAKLAIYPTLESTEQEELLSKVDSYQSHLKLRAQLAPMNFQHQYDLVEAERYRVLGNKAEAIALYDKAIAGAKANHYIQEEALANELAAKFYLEWGKGKIAAGYMQEAYYCYSRWGAKAKVYDLETRYPQLLEPILRQAKTSFNPLETLIDTTYTLDQASTSSTSVADTLDFVSVLKAAQTISSEIKLDELLRQLTQIILQNSGADKCVLVLPQDGTWQVRAIATIESTELCLESLESNANVPLKLIQYIKRMKSVVVIDDLETDLPVIGNYLTQHQPKSALGLPILNQGNLEGIIYLENQSTAGVFTSDRLTIINFLGAQAAISIKNAQLYQQSQNYAQQLQQSQLQIIQSEKMSALGNLVSGVAHEINNPVGFLNGNIQPALDYIQDLFGLVDLYQQKYPQPDADIQAEITTIELEYIREDLPKLIDSMQEGVKRIQDISNSLRTFSRADTDYPVACNIHDGIDSTIMILKHRLKANEFRPKIQVIKNYGKLPQIECYAGQMNQVFMNILANAIDALEESNHGRSFRDIKANPNCITITTSVENNQIEIAIADNGKGMSTEIKARVFDHLFTTKSVGKGTGLGLAIAKQIIEEKHHGNIDLISNLEQGSEFIITLPITTPPFQIYGIH